MKRWDSGAAILICAHNEENSIGKTIELIRQTGFSGKVVVVNDGSTDQTAHIAQKKGAIVLSLPSNQGKAFAFFSGMATLKKLHAKTVITFDADMEVIPRTELERLINKTHEYTAAGKIASVAVNVREGTVMASDVHSGIRGYSEKAVDALTSLRLNRFVKTTFTQPVGDLFARVRARKRAPITGMGLEDFLNFYFTTKKGAILDRQHFEHPFAAKPAYRGDSLRQRSQHEQISWAQYRIQALAHYFEARRKRPQRKK